VTREREALLRAAEHHSFAIGGRELLFDVNALAVAESCELDRVLLDAAATPRPASELLARAAGGGFDARGMRIRLRVLRDLRFLLGADESPRRVRASDDTRYATFMINVAQRCNLTCSYCYVNRGAFDYETMPMARLDPALAGRVVELIHERFPRFESYGYHFYGGEPLLNFAAIRGIVAAAEEAAARDGTETDFHVTTNGTLMTAEVVDFFDEHRFTVYVSIDGDEATHDAVRKYADGRGSFRDVERNLAYLRTKHRLHLIGSAVVRKGLPLLDAIELLQQHGANQCKAERVRLGESDPLALRDEERARYIDDIHALIDHYVTHLAAGRRPPDFRLSAKILQLLVRTRRNFFCPAGTRMFGIAADGDVYPCALHVGRPRSRLGSLAGGIDAAAQRDFRTRFSSDARAECRDCWTRNLCGGGCSANVDRFGHDDCASMRAESEAAIAIYAHFARTDITRLYSLVDPSVARWIEDGNA
jgi:uncharacterized protein